MEVGLSYAEHVFYHLGPSGFDLFFFFFISISPRLFHLLEVMARPA